MNKFCRCITLLAVPLAVYAQSPPMSDVDATFQHQLTPVPDDARFALVQALYSAKGTFLLDRQLGDVWQLAGPSSTGLYIWQKVPVTRQKSDAADDVTKINYALFVSGIGLRFTVLINIRTGASWQFATTEDGSVFAPIKKD